MSYKIYTTRGIVFETYPQGESNLFIKVFTKDHGLITVISQGTRLLKSKLRYGIQELTYGSFSFVRGREYWRLTSSEKLMSFAGAGVKVPQKKIIKRLFVFIDRFIKGEEKVEELFDFIEKYIKFVLVEYSNSSSADGASLYKDGYLSEVAKLNVLSLLGYTTTQKVFAPCICAQISTNESSKSVKEAVEYAQTLPLIDIQAEVEKIISETHL